MIKNILLTFAILALFAVFTQSMILMPNPSYADEVDWEYLEEFPDGTRIRHNKDGSTCIQEYASFYTYKLSQDGMTYELTEKHHSECFDSCGDEVSCVSNEGKAERLENFKRGDPCIVKDSMSCLLVNTLIKMRDIENKEINCRNGDLWSLQRKLWTCEDKLAEAKRKWINLF